MKTTDSVLDRIVADKKEYLAGKKRAKSLDRLKDELAGLEPREEPGFFDALKAGRPQPKIIAEVKKASPSAGVLREPFSLEEINEAYQTSENVVAISVITERGHFQGSEDALAFFAHHNANRKPLLRKDFIFDPYQIFESKLLGAQAYLLIASLFDQDELAGLVDLGLEIGLEPLVEIHDKDELDMALTTKARCIGANSRDLKTFKIDPEVHDLLKRVDGSYARIAESGIGDKAHMKRLAAYTDAVLIGTEFMKSDDIAMTIQDISALAEAMS
jgi:indole-3-glycerol phosphate synthase